MNLGELENFENNISSSHMPPLVIVRKTFPKAHKKLKHRIWKLKHLEKEAIDENNIHKKKAEGKQERDYEMFIRDIEEQPEIR